MRIASIHAHPDDAELFCGGTLALLAQKGHHITIASLSTGDCGSAELPREKISEVRREEARKAAAVIGGEYEWGGFYDFRIFDDEASRTRAISLLRRIRPDIILTSSPVDYMADHDATSKLVRDACFGAPMPNYETGDPPLEKIPYLYFMDPVGCVFPDGTPCTPDFTVDVSSTFETKREMFACHESQREWLRRQHGMDEYLDQMEKWTRVRGKTAGIEFGEGFRQFKGHPYPERPLLQELLGL